MKKIFQSVFLILFLLMSVSQTVFAQEALKRFGLDIPVTTKSQAKITEIDIVSVSPQADNSIEIKGTFGVQNYGEEETGELYFSALAGVKSGEYLLKYPVQQDVRSETFTVPPKQTITKEFSITEKNIAQFEKLGVEIRLFDSYDKKINVKSLPVEFYQEQSFSNIATSTHNFVLNNTVLDATTTNPVFNTETDTLEIQTNIESEQDVSLESIQLKIYKDAYYQEPLKILSINQDESFTIPSDLEAGKYVFEIAFNSQNKEVFVPRIYEKFIVDGNVNTVHEVTYEKKGKLISLITTSVKGYGAVGIASSTEEYFFDTEIILYDKEGEELWRGQKQKDSAWFFRNITIELDQKIKFKDVYKIKVNLIDEGGIFDTFEKDITHTESNLLITLLSILGGIILLVLLIVFKKHISNHKQIVVSIVALLALLGITNLVETAITPTPFEDIGFFVFDSDEEWTSASCTYCYDEYDGSQNLFYRADLDLDASLGTTVLDAWGADIFIDEPTFVSQDPEFCYDSGTVIPLVIRYEGPIFYNGATPSAYFRSYTKDNGWYAPLRYRNFYPTDVGNIDGDAGVFDWTYENPDYNTWPSPDLEYWATHLANIEEQSGRDSIEETWAQRADGSWYLASVDAIPSTWVLNANDWLVDSAIYLHSWFAQLGTAKSLFEQTTINQNSMVIQKSLIAPENPGTYDLFTTFSEAKYSNLDIGTYYISQHQIKVCDRPHDADFTMEGYQYVGADGEVYNEDGTVLEGYTVSGAYGIDDDYLEPQLCYYSGVLSADQNICGYNVDPEPKFSVLSVANYCGYQSPASTWDNNWINLYSQIKDTTLNTRAGYNTINSFYPKYPGTRFALFAHKPLYSGGVFSRYLTTATSTRPNFTGSRFDFYVHNDDGNIKFMDLDEIEIAMNGAIDLNDSNNVPYYTFGEILNTGLFNYSSYLSTTENNTSNTYLVKENLRYSSTVDQQSTCSIYEDFCTSVPGVQYIYSYGSTLSLYNLVNGERQFVTSVPYNANEATAQAMCNAVTPTPSVNVSCSASLPSNPADRNINTPITFSATVSDADTTFPIAYSWQNAIAGPDGNTATASYSTVGSKNDVVVTVTNGTEIASTTCPVEIVAESLALSCTGSPASYTLAESETSKSFSFSYTADKPIASQVWKDSSDTIKSTDASYSETFSTIGTYGRTVYATSTTGAAASATCYVTLQTPIYITEESIVDVFEFRPEVLEPPATTCPLYLDVSSVTSCTLENTISGQELQFATTSPNIIYIDGTEDIEIGTWSLMCTGVGTNAQPQPRGIQRCITNPAYREN